MLLACFCLLGTLANGQSLDMATPALVRGDQVAGTILARDLGDSRLTDHFFTFVGTPGDLLITVETRNLNGDVDVFTVTGMRPLLKFTVYEGSAPVITKSIYLRKRENLILRVEARTPNDDEGTYRIKFSGSFEAGAGPLGENDREPSVSDKNANGELSTSKTGKKGRRVSSVGARIDEPQSTETAEAKTAEPEAPETSAKEVTAPKSTTRTARGRSTSRPPANSRTRKPSEPKAKPQTETGENTTAETKEAEAKPAPRRRSGKRPTTARTVEPTAPAEPESGPRLVIETSDGTLINRFMSSIRRVTVENGQVVVVGKDGKVDRFQLANIVRMSVGP